MLKALGDVQTQNLTGAIRQVLTHQPMLTPLHPRTQIVGLVIHLGVIHVALVVLAVAVEAAQLLAQQALRLAQQALRLAQLHHQAQQHQRHHR